MLEFLKIDVCGIGFLRLNAGGESGLAIVAGDVVCVVLGVIGHARLGFLELEFERDVLLGIVIPYVLGNLDFV